MKKLVSLALVCLMAFPLSAVAMAKPQVIDFPNSSSPVSLDLTDVFEDNGFLQPGKTYYIPVMYGNYHLETEELERYRFQVSVENLNEEENDDGSYPTHGGSVSLTTLDGYRYVRFASTASIANRDNVTFRITLDSYDKLDRGWVRPETAEVDVGYGATDFCSDDELEVDNDAPVVEFADEVDNCVMTFPDGSVFQALLVDNTRRNEEEGILRKINLYSTTTPIQLVANKYPGYNLQYLNFSTATTFQDTSILRIYAPGRSYLYSVNTLNELTRLSYVQSGDFMVLTGVRTLGTYVMTSVELPNVPSGSAGGGSGSVTAPAAPGGTLTANQAGTAADTAFNAGGREVRFAGIADVALDAMQTVAAKARAKGIAATVLFDTLSASGGIDTRLYVAPDRVTKAFSSSARFDDAAVGAVRTLFGNWYRNRVAVLWLGQAGDYGMRVDVAAKLNLTGFDTTRLAFYSYTPATNSYLPLAAPAYWLDGAGYLHFTTTVGNTIVVSEGALAAK